MAKVFEQGDLAVAACGEVAVATFGGDGNVFRAVPDEEGFAQAGSGGDEAAVAGGFGVALVEGKDLVGVELGNAVAVGFEVVDEEDVLDAEGLREVAGVEAPGEVGEFEAAVADGAGAAKAGSGDVCRRGGSCGGVACEELLDDVVEGGELVGGELMVADGVELAVGEVIEG